MKFDIVVRRKEGEEKERREGERRKGQRAPRAGETENSKETEEKNPKKKRNEIFRPTGQASDAPGSPRTTKSVSNHFQSACSWARVGAVLHHHRRWLKRGRRRRERAESAATSSSALSSLSPLAFAFASAFCGDTPCPAP